MTTTRERRLARAEKLRNWSAGRTKKAASAFRTARILLDGIPLGQPILVGHHSEKRHRRTVDRAGDNLSAGVAHERKAADMKSRAGNIEDAVAASIFSDDPDAVEQLTAKIAALEFERARINVVNKAIRKHGYAAIVAGETGFVMTDDEHRTIQMLIRVTPYHQAETRGFPAYHGKNLGGNINRLKARLAGLTRAALPSKPITGDTATARAGLEVAAEMTTPRRPGKAPRPVWVVRGNVAFWRSLLERIMGGTWYRGAVSFWEDPTAELEDTLAAEERAAAEKAAAL